MFSCYTQRPSRYQTVCYLQMLPVAARQYKKFELMLTGRAKAYSSSCPQAVTHRSSLLTRPGVE